MRKRTLFRQCSVKECEDHPWRRYRMTGGTVLYLNLCRRHGFLMYKLPAGVLASEVTPREWLVGEVMDS